MSAFVPSVGCITRQGQAQGPLVSSHGSAFCGHTIPARPCLPVAARRYARMQMADDEEPRLDEMNAGAGPSEQAFEESKLFVGNLSWSTTDASLGDAFAEFGEVIDSKVVTDRFTGKSRGFGFITFSEASSADAALENMNGADVDGRPIRIDRANKRVGGPRPRRNYY